MFLLRRGSERTRGTNPRTCSADSTRRRLVRPKCVLTAPSWLVARNAAYPAFKFLLEPATPKLGLPPLSGPVCHKSSLLGVERLDKRPNLLAGLMASLERNTNQNQAEKVNPAKSGAYMLPTRNCGLIRNPTNLRGFF